MVMEAVDAGVAGAEAADTPNGSTDNTNSADRRRNANFFVFILIAMRYKICTTHHEKWLCAWYRSFHYLFLLLIWLILNPNKPIVAAASSISPAAANQPPVNSIPEVGICSVK